MQNEYVVLVCSYPFLSGFSLACKFVKVLPLHLIMFSSCYIIVLYFVSVKSYLCVNLKKNSQPKDKVSTRLFLTVLLWPLDMYILYISSFVRSFRWLAREWSILQKNSHQRMSMKDYKQFLQRANYKLSNNRIRDTYQVCFGLFY